MKTLFTTLLKIFVPLLIFLYFWFAPGNGSSKKVVRWSSNGGQVSDTIFDNVRFGTDEAQLYADLGISPSQKYRFNQRGLAKYEFDVEPDFVDGQLKGLDFVVRSEDNIAISDAEFDAIADALSDQYGETSGRSQGKKSYGLIYFWKSDVCTIGNEWMKNNLRVELFRKESRGDTFFRISYTDMHVDTLDTSDLNV